MRPTLLLLALLVARPSGHGAGTAGLVLLGALAGLLGVAAAVAATW